MNSPFLTHNKVQITEVVLRDAHQSLFATRLRLDDILPIAEQLDTQGFQSIEAWGGATFDACIRFLGEDPWHRLREIKKLMPKTPLQMLLRAQNLLGYRHYADDVVRKFVERAYKNGIEVFRIFDAHNDIRNFKAAIDATKALGGHAQGTISYTTSPVHNLEGWVLLARQLEDSGADSICIKDMAGLLRPYEGYELVKSLKQQTALPIQLHAHATTGFSTPTILKCIEAGIDGVDTAISSMSMTYGHSPTETIIAMLEGTERETVLDLEKLIPIAEYFQKIRPKYAQFEGSLKGIDPRIIKAQVPGGMLTNMENQLRDQNASDRFNDVLQEIPKVRKDLGFIPLVTPSSQIVGTQAVLNVLSGERYKTMSEETKGILRGEYGTTPAALNAELQQRVLGDKEPITVRPADLLTDELNTLETELLAKAKQNNVSLAKGERQIEDVLTYALFPQVGFNFIKNRNRPDAFEPVPNGIKNISESGDYKVEVEGKSYRVRVDADGDIESAHSATSATSTATRQQPTATKSPAQSVPSPLAGNIMKILVNVGDIVETNQALIIIEAMKMETEIVAPFAGTVNNICVKSGDKVQVGDTLIQI